jgi:hypothetical protein
MVSELSRQFSEASHRYDDIKLGLIPDPVGVPAHKKKRLSGRRYKQIPLRHGSCEIEKVRILNNQCAVYFS